MSERHPQAVIVEFRTVIVTIAPDHILGGASVSMRHRRASARKPVELRGDEAAFVEFIRSSLIGPVRDCPHTEDSRPRGIDVAGLARALEGALPGRMSTPEAEWSVYCREVAERVEELL